jgi:hypothetical protein
MIAMGMSSLVQPVSRRQVKMNFISLLQNCGLCTDITLKNTVGLWRFTWTNEDGTK